MKNHWLSKLYPSSEYALAGLLALGLPGSDSEGLVLFCWPLPAPSPRIASKPACPVATNTQAPTTRWPSVYFLRHPDEGRWGGIHQRTVSLHGRQSGLGVQVTSSAEAARIEWMNEWELPKALFVDPRLFYITDRSRLCIRPGLMLTCTATCRNSRLHFSISQKEVNELYSFNTLVTHVYALAILQLAQRRTKFFS